MSTNINISVGDNKLLDQARLQQTASRQAQLEKEANKRLQSEAEINRVNALAAQGKDANGNTITAPGTVPKPLRDEPAANRAQQGVVVNGVGIKITENSSNAGLIDWSVRVEIGSVSGTQVTEFNYPYRTTSSVETPAPSGFPTTWANIPTKIGDYISQTTSFTYKGLYLRGSTFITGGDNENSTFDTTAGSYTITEDLPAIVTSANNSRTFVLPDGNGNTYVIYVLNRLYRRRIDRVTKTATSSAWTLADYEILVGPVVNQGSTFYPIKWNGAPEGCYTAFLQGLDPVAEAAYWTANEKNYYYTGTQRIDATREIALNVEFQDYAIHAYKVTKNTATEITVPPAVDTWMRSISPPLAWNTTTTVPGQPSGGNSVRWDAVTLTNGTLIGQNPGFHEESSTAWPGTYVNCFPDIQAYQTVASQIQDIVYPSYSSSIYFSSTTAYNQSTTNLVFTMGGKGIYSPYAFGPSFALTYNKNIKALTQAQRESYDYMRGFLGSSPKQYVAKCVIPGSCPGNLLNSQLDVTWYQSDISPTTFAGISPVDSYKLVRNGAFIAPTHLRSGYSILWVTNWGDNKLCKQALLPLGL